MCGGSSRRPRASASSGARSPTHGELNATWSESSEGTYNPGRGLAVGEPVPVAGVVTGVPTAVPAEPVGAWPRQLVMAMKQMRVNITILFIAAKPLTDSRLGR
jgi:hypothetical protein